MATTTALGITNLEENTILLRKWIKQGAGSTIQNNNTEQQALARKTSLFTRTTTTVTGLPTVRNRPSRSYDSGLTQFKATAAAVAADRLHSGGGGRWWTLFFSQEGRLTIKMLPSGSISCTPCCTADGLLKPFRHLYHEAIHSFPLGLPPLFYITGTKASQMPLDGLFSPGGTARRLGRWSSLGLWAVTFL